MTLGRLVTGLALIPPTWLFLICWKLFGALGFNTIASKCWIVGYRIADRGAKLLEQQS